MKNLIKCFSAILMLTLILTGCSDKEVEEKKEELSKIEETVVKNLKDIETYTKEDIEVATNYIEKNIDKVKDGDIAKKVAEYGYYLENAAKSGSKDISHDLANLGKEASEYAGKVYTAAEDEKEEIMKDSEKLINNWGSKLANEKDKLIEEFHNLINK